MDNKYDVFISYSRHDANLVNEFVERLEREGFSVWIDRDGIESGDAFKKIILQAIKNSAVVLFFSSQHSNQSSWTAKEIGVAVKYKKPIVPILLDGSNFNEEVEFDLINLDFIDYQDVTLRETMMDRLVKSLKAKIPNPIGLKKAEEARLKAEAAERERLERERWQNEETERSEREEAERKFREEAERQPTTSRHSGPSFCENGTRSPKLTDTIVQKLKNKKILWIALAAAVAAIAAILLLRQPKQKPVPLDPPSQPLTVTDNDHEYVDLGLPSGILWATCNVGANTPEEYGDYFAWGETRPKDYYDWSTYQYCNGDYNQLTKYCNDSEYGNNGFTDNLIILRASDDPATANWGNDWHMPNNKQWEELLHYTTNRWTTQNGVSGWFFFAKNGNSLFLPAAGWRLDGELDFVGSNGYYWSRSLFEPYPYFAWCLVFEPDFCSREYKDRCCGFSVRPVRER